MKLDDGAEGDLADLRVHLPEGRAVALQGLHDPEQGPVDGRTRDLAVHDSLLAAGLLGAHHRAGEEGRAGMGCAVETAVS